MNTEKIAIVENLFGRLGNVGRDRRANYRRTSV
jgi:hypothetical protein